MAVKANVYTWVTGLILRYLMRNSNCGRMRSPSSAGVMSQSYWWIASRRFQNSRNAVAAAPHADNYRATTYADKNNTASTQIDHYNQSQIKVYANNYNTISTHSQKFCSLAVLDPRLATPWTYFLHFISVHCYSDDWLFHGESCPCIDVVHPSSAWSSSPACTCHCSLHYLFLQATPVVPHGATMLCQLPCFDTV